MNARLIDPADWQVAAACKGQYDLFFPPDDADEIRLLRRARERQAKAICAHCRVREDCLLTALRDGEDFGIWGGATARERRAMLRSDQSPLDIAGPGRLARLPAAVARGRSMSHRASRR